MARPYEFNMQFSADTSDAERDINELSREVGEVADAASEDIELNVDTSKTEAAIKATSDRLDTLRDEFRDNLELDLDNDEVRKEMRQVERDLRDLRKIAKDEGKAAGKDYGQSFGKNVDIRKEFNKNADGMKQEAGQIGRESATSFTGEFEDISDIGRDLLANMFQDLGPAGALAGVAAAAGIGLIVNEATKAQEAIEELNEESFDAGLALAFGDAEARASQLNETLEELLGTAEGGFAWWADATVLVEDLATALEQGAVGTDLLSDAFQAADAGDLAGTIEGLNGALDNMDEATRRDLEALQELGRTQEVTGRSTRGLTDEQEAANTALRNNNEIRGELRGDIEKYIEELERQEKIQAALADVTVEQFRAQQQLDEELKVAQDAYKEATDALNEYLDAGNQAQVTLDDVKESTQLLAEENIKAALDTDKFSEAALSGRDALNKAEEAALKHIEALVEDGASAEEASAAAEAYNDDLRKQAEESGLTKDEIDDLIDTYGIVPEDVKTEVEAVNAAEAEAAIKAVEQAGREVDGKTWTTYVNTIARTSYGASSGSNTVGGGYNPANPGRSASPQSASVNVVRVNIAGREVDAQVEQSVHRARSSESLDVLMGTGARY